MIERASSKKARLDGNAKREYGTDMDWVLDELNKRRTDERRK